MIIGQVFGLLLQLAGTVMAGRALWADYVDHGGEPLGSRARRLVTRLRGAPPVVQGGGAGSASAHVRMSGEGSLTVSTVPPPDDTSGAQVTYLRGRVDGLTRELVAMRDQLEGVRQESARRGSELQQRVETVKQEGRRRLDELATVRVSTELCGLVLVGAGSIISTVSSLG